MLYVCSCGYTAATATAFYKHLAASKESGAGHQLTQARFSDKPGKLGSKADDVSQVPAGQQAPGTATWVDEYLMVDQRDDIAAQGPQAHLPVSSAPPAPALGRPPQQSPTSSGLEDVPLRELQGLSQSWRSMGRSRSGAVGRPPIPTARANSAAAAAAVSSAAAEPPERALESEEVELVEHIRDPRPSNSGASRGSGGTAAQAALRVSGSVVNAMVVGLSPWRWFGNGGVGGGPADGLASEPFGGGTPYVEGLAAQADALGGPPIAGEAAGEAGPGSLQQLLQQQQRQAYLYVPDSPAASLGAVHAVRDVLIWRNPWRTSRVFGAGLYAAVCARQLAKGHELLQPSTAIFALCFILLLRNVVRQAAATYRRNLHHQQHQQHQQQQGSQGGQAVAMAVAAVRAAAGEAEGEAEAEACSSPSQSARDAADVERRQAALQLQLRVEAVLQRVALGAARYGAALVVLGVGLLSGRRAITSALVAALLWLGMVLGELRLISQPTFWLLCYVAAFTIPAAYYRCRPAMDAGVETALRFVARVLLSGSRTALAAAGGVAAVLLAALPLNFVLRASLAAAAAFAVLLWQSGLGAHARAAYGSGGGGPGAQHGRLPAAEGLGGGGKPLVGGSGAQPQARAHED